ncbi:MAG: type II toxin-antitoxin system RelE/ParE family toxin [Acidobacteria bacterium]|nr:type II toxin-antitoxin system RelE/ParE family toxin [Acidobacteriota bacterium]
MRWAVHSLDTPRGTTTLEEFVDGLSDDTAAEAEALVEMLEQHGNKLRLPVSKPLGNGLFEARGLTTGVRLFFVFAPGHRIVVLDGYVKKRTSIPARIMARIRRLQAGTEEALLKKEGKN